MWNNNRHFLITLPGKIAIRRRKMNETGTTKKFFFFSYFLSLSMFLI